MSRIDKLVRELGERLQADLECRAFVLLDPMLREPLPQPLWDRYGQESLTIPVQHISLKPEQCPRLVSLRPQAVDLLQATLEEALREQSLPGIESSQGFSIGGWLVAKEEPETLVRYLSGTMMKCVPRSVTGKMVRWADRRVLQWLWDGLEDDQREDLLGPILSWTTLDRRGQLVTYGMDERTGISRPLKLTRGQWERAAHCETVQAMLRGWRSFAEDLPEDYQQRAESAVSGAMGIGLERQQDIILLGAYQLQLHPRLSTHPEVIRLVRQSQSTGEPLHKLLATIPDPDGWDRIRDELESDVLSMQDARQA